MAKKKKIKVPFHIQNDYKQYSYEDGGLKITFWAKDDADAELYRKKVEGKQCLNLQQYVYWPTLHLKCGIMIIKIHQSFKGV